MQMSCSIDIMRIGDLIARIEKNKTLQISCECKLIGKPGNCDKGIKTTHSKRNQRFQLF